MKFTILGCGASLGVPSAGNFWGACDAGEPRNRRTRASLLVRTEKTALVVDATYDFREHMNRHDVKDLDAALLTHAHSDHVSGADDLRGYAYRREKLLDVYSDAETLDEVGRRTPHLFHSAQNVYTAFLNPCVIDPYASFTVGDIAIESFAQDHTTCRSLGFRFGDFAYSADVADLEEKALQRLKGLETWVVDAGAYHREHITTHANLARVTQWVERLKPKMTYLTVLTSHMDYKTLCDELPPHIRPAWDGLEIEAGTNRR